MSHPTHDVVVIGGGPAVRGYRYARWTDGSSHLWLARAISAGRGEGASGLKFDVVAPTPPT